MPTARVTNSLFDIQITMKKRGQLPIVVMVRRLLDLLPTLIQQLVKECQKDWLEDDLGPFGTVGQLFDHDSLRCPRCESPDANRKGWSDRSWTVPVLGELDVPLRWVECQRCGRSWTPYKETLGIKDHVLYSSDVMIKHLEEAIRTTYQAASQMDEDSPSAITIWRQMLASEPTLQRNKDVEDTVCVDATKIPKHKETGQWVLTVAQAVESSNGPWNRTCLAGTVGQEVDIKEPLRQYDIQRMMHDGQLNVDDLCDTEGRCGWHVPHTVRLLLHQDDIHGEDNKRRWYWLHSIVCVGRPRTLNR